MRRATITFRSQPNRRRGGFLIVAMICLLLSTVLVGTVLTLVQAQRRQMTQEQICLQTDWLAESGLERAVARLKADAAYTGETWSVTADELGGAEAGEVMIDIRPVENHPDQRIVHVEAIYPAGAKQAVRRTRQTTVVLFQES